MHMCAATMASVIGIVFAITIIAFLVGKLNKFGNSDDIITLDEEDK